MVENGVQLTLTSSVKSTGKARISGEGMNGSHTMASIKKNELQELALISGPVNIFCIAQMKYLLSTFFLVWYGKTKKH
jgi:hypothetical protein